MSSDLLETTAELMTSRRQLMTSLFLLLMLSLHQTISYVDVSRQNNVVVDDNDNYDSNNNNNTGWTRFVTFTFYVIFAYFLFTPIGVTVKGYAYTRLFGLGYRNHFIVVQEKTALTFLQYTSWATQQLKC